VSDGRRPTSDSAPPLAGLHVVERADGLAGAYAGFLLAGLGADVVRIEPTPAARADPAARVLHRGKRSATFAPVTWDALLAGADAVVTDESTADVGAAGGLVSARLTTWTPDGHPRRLPSDEALVAAVTGVQAMQWSWAGRPVWFVTPVVSYMTGMLGALGVTAALFARARGAPGQRVRTDGLRAAFALNSGTYVSGPKTQGSLSQFGDPRGQYPTYSLYRTADGWLFVGALTQAFLVKLLGVVDRLELLADPRLPPVPLAYGAPDIKALVRGVLDPIFVQRPTAEWVRLLRAADVPCGPVCTREQALADEDARALRAVVTTDDPVLGPTPGPGVPAVFSVTPAPAPRAAPRPGADTDAVHAQAKRWRRPVYPRRPLAACLDGIRVLDLASYIAGPLCPMLLAELGADVVKVESVDGDPFRLAAFGFIGWNRGKRSLVLDLKRPAGRDVFLDLARSADVVVDNFRPGVMERLGLDWTTLAATNARLVHTSITGWGSTGPLAGLPGFDPIFQARSGLMAAQGGDDDPVFHMIAYNDYAAGTLGALATVAALLARERTGRGQRVDVSLLRTSYLAQAAHLESYERGGRDHLGPSPLRRLYACRDGWVCVAASTRAHAHALGRLAGTAPVDGEAVARILGALARPDALDRLDAAGVPAAPCLTFTELFEDAYLRAAGCVVVRDHPGLGPVQQPGPFIDFDETPMVSRRTAPGLGADGREVLGEIGYDAERIATLIAAGVVGQPR
jgi:crotonobetainyl-CoA:carnitine CoA-transferase CaiB-like acyl-CoA transferase